MGYYSTGLAAEKLKKVYDLATPTVRRYLEAETGHVCKLIKEGDLVLDLGCGYGRTMPQFAEKAGYAAGIDSSINSLRLAVELTGGIANSFFACMDASELSFRDNSFDTVVCIQNGISAFHVDQRKLIGESIRVTRPGGLILFSSYSDKFWDHRLEWFRLQADAGLLGDIDMSQTGNGVIVCVDGFKATTVSPADFEELTSGLDIGVNIVEVDESSIFCEIHV